MTGSLDKSVLEKIVYEACLSAAVALGDDLKGLSWFGTNYRRSAIRKAA